MDNALEQLEQLVLRAEFSVRSDGLKKSLDAASSQLREAEKLSAERQQALREIRLRRVPEIENAKREEQRLQEILQKAARLQPNLDRQQVETLAAAARTKCQSTLAAATDELQTAEAGAKEALALLEQATAAYQQARHEFDRLAPAGTERPVADDEVLARAEQFFPSGRLRSLERDVQRIGSHFGHLSNGEQFYQLSVWIGRLRQLQGENLTEDEHRRSRQLFGQLVGISKQYEPGYIEAFRQEFQTDWGMFIAEAERLLGEFGEKRLKAEEARRADAEEKQRRAEQEQEARVAAEGAFERLRNVIATYELPDSGAEEFREALRSIKGVSASDQELLDLVLPYRELLSEGSDFRALRRNLDKIVEEQDSAARGPAVNVDDVLHMTAGKRCVVIGGSRREEVRAQLEQLFQFERLVWEDYERTHGGKLNSLEQSVKNGGIDLMLILRSYVHHHVSEKLRPLCKQYEVPCFMVDHGYGAAQIAATLRQRSSAARDTNGAKPRSEAAMLAGAGK